MIEIGKWLEVNGAAIYGTRPWEVFGEGPTKVPEGAFSDTRRNAFTSEDIRFTTKDGVLYATILQPSESGHYTVKSLGRKMKHIADGISSVKQLGSNEQLQWKWTDEGLVIDSAVSSDCRNPVVFAVN